MSEINQKTGLEKYNQKVSMKFIGVKNTMVHGKIGRDFLIVDLKEGFMKQRSELLK